MHEAACNNHYDSCCQYFSVQLVSLQSDCYKPGDKKKHPIIHIPCPISLSLSLSLSLSCAHPFTLKEHLVTALMSSTLTPSAISISVSPSSKSTSNTPYRVSNNTVTNRALGILHNLPYL